MFPGILPPNAPRITSFELSTRQKKAPRRAGPPVYEVQSNPLSAEQRRPSTYVPTRSNSQPAPPSSRSQRVQWPSSIANPRQASTATRNDSVFPGHLEPKEKQDSVSRRKSVAVFLKTRSWSLFQDPPPTDIEGHFDRDEPIVPPVRKWAWRSRHDIMLRCVLIVAFGLAATMVTFGVVYYVTHRLALANDKDTFICGYDGRGPKCATQLVGEPSAMEKVDYINDGMVKHWLRAHCEWRKAGWRCGPMIGKTDTGVFPEGTYLQPLAEDEAAEKAT